jgi:spore germination cell wall hydrolase CwlJ-like protein
MYGTLGPYYGALALGRTVGIPSPFETVNRGFFLHDSFRRGREMLEQPTDPLGEGRATPGQYSTSTRTQIDTITGQPVDTTFVDAMKATQPEEPPKESGQLRGIFDKFGLAKAYDYLEDRLTSYMDFPMEMNPLTGTVRATGLSPMLKDIPGVGFVTQFADAARRQNLENLHNIAVQSGRGRAGYSTGLLENQLVGVKPQRDTFHGKVLGFLDIDLEGYQLQGNIGSYENVPQSVYESALTEVLLENPPIVHGPARSLALGIKPGQLGYYGATMTQTNLTPLLQDKLGIDRSMVPGVASYIDRSGNRRAITSGTYVSDFGLTVPNVATNLGFANTGFEGFSNVEGGFTDFSGIDPTGTSQAFSKSPAAVVGMEDEYDDGRDDQSPGRGATESQREGFSREGGPGGAPFNRGGRVGYAMGTPKVTQGFINKDPDSVTDKQSIADNRYTKVELATMVMNQPSNDKYEKHLDKLIAEAKRNVKLSDKKYKMVDVALSDGERTIHPEYVAYIEKKMGKGYLEKLNDEGKAEVSRRQAKYGSKVGASNGGFIEKQGMEIIDQPSGGINQLNEIYDQYKNKFKSPEIARKKAKELFKSLPAEDALALVMMGEASILGSEGMRGVAHVIMNRTDSDFKDFSKLNSVFDVVTQRTQGGKGIYQFNALEPRTLRETLRQITQTSYGKNKYQKLRNDAEEILAGVQEDFTQGSLFFWNPEESTDKTFKEKVESGEWVPTTETVTNFGGKKVQHQYLIPESIRQLPVN